MDAEQVTEKILTDARAEAEKITNEAKENQSAEQAELKKQLEDYSSRTQTLAKKAGEDKQAHILAAARMDIAKEYLTEKRKVLDEVFAQAHQQLQGLSDKDYQSLCSSLMLKAVETGDEEVIVDDKEKRIDHEFIKHINRELSPGYKGNLRLAKEKQSLGGGFILKRGKIKNNVSFEVLLAQARKELEIELAKELFA